MTRKKQKSPKAAPKGGRRGGKKHRAATLSTQPMQEYKPAPPTIQLTKHKKEVLTAKPSPSPSTYTADVKRNAAEWVRALYDPFHFGPCRIPDILNYPTGLARLQAEQTVAIPAAVGRTNVQCFFRNFPLNGTGLDTTFNYRYGGGGGYGSWQNPGVNGVTSLGTLAKFARTSAYACRVRLLDAITSRAGELRMSRVADISQLDANVGNFTYGPAVGRASLGSSEADGMWLAGLMSSYADSLDFSPLTLADDGNHPDDAIVIEFVIPDNTALNFMVEWVQDVEYLPNLGYLNVVDVASAPGSADSVAALTDAIEQSAGGGGGSGADADRWARAADIATKAFTVGKQALRVYNHVRSGGSLSQLEQHVLRAHRAVERRRMPSTSASGRVSPEPDFTSVMSASSGRGGGAAAAASAALARR